MFVANRKAPAINAKTGPFFSIALMENRPDRQPIPNVK